jgi:hypothetical protein
MAKLSAELDFTHQIFSKTEKQPKKERTDHAGTRLL